MRKKMLSERIENILCEVFMPEEITEVVPAILQAIQDEVEGLRKEETTPGKNCRCGAYGSSECGCGADWTDWSIFNLAIDKIKEKLK
jgi:hypothetical protein